ncbi:MAG: hypothetical protein CMC96_08625 [Flavobacteriales bacterium]|nr:hypothetical protein [Flavobacteriales bacterium]|tara:strand:+ start:7197 stop:8474 length:1278 start_codon:yes stop_codon:yes gene_type:complete
MIIGILFCLLLLLALTFSIQKSRFFKIRSIPKSWIWMAFSLKLIAALTLTSIYTYYYQNRSQADIYKYYDDAVVLKKAHQDKSDLFWETFLPENMQSESFRHSLSQTLHWDLSTTYLINDNRTLIRLNYLLLYLSGEFYFFHLLFFCTLSFLGSIALFRFFNANSSLPSQLIFIVVFGVPSLLFWSSALLKESILLFTLGFFLLFAQKVFIKNQLKFLPLFIVFLFLSFTVKIYVFLALAIPLLLYLISQRLSIKKQKAAYSIIGISLIALFFSLKNKLLITLKEKLIDFKAIAEAANAGSQIYMPTYENLSELIQLIPLALYNVLIHPLIPPKWSLLSSVAAMEHLFLVGILVLPIIAFKKQTKQLPFFWFCISFVLILSCLIGLSTPVLGAIVRYKVPLIPFYLIALLTFVNLNKIPLLKKLK